MADEETSTGTDARARVAAILASFHGKATTITDAGRENIRTVNKVSRVAALRHAGNERTFAHNISRYRCEALDEDILIGARREGNGVWSLIAEFAPPGT